MEKVKAIVIDDEKASLDILEHFLEKYCPHSVNVVGRSTEIEEGIVLINKLRPELLFMDIMMNEGTGFDILDEIDEYNYKIIFVTAFDNFAIKSFQYNAIDYILKPIQLEDLILSVNKATSEIRANVYTEKRQLDMLSNVIDNINIAFQKIVIPSNNKIDFVKMEDIVYCKSDGRYTTFYLIDGQELVSSKNLGEYETMLDSNFFYRVHNSYIINLNHIVRITKESGCYCYMVNGKSIPIAKRRQDLLFRFLNVK
ncbi:LytTR family DNA-binding domain-containing protein [Galbibacter sp. EGI 63066]|uniref:LytR/AlgR family response regulator transcription factor n=1 Tax=Galbibacter sp. EGI 63066 TaxID=2993559 RepID=UPI00224932E1|nr:LytTR family DNA-binding domain-containing protein [Galbibacter sp. EGI 63066]MCX2681968.1 LytTR family DNA-binding domain-containing protein [Galbibacter sp. EGI 63066]